MKPSISITILLAVFLVSCSKSHENLILGTWRGYDASLLAKDTLQVKDTAAWNQGIAIHRATTFTFNADSTFRGVVNTDLQKDTTLAKWALSQDGKVLSLEFANGFKDSNIMVDSLSGDFLVLRYQYPFGEITMSFTKEK